MIQRIEAVSGARSVALVLGLGRGGTDLARREGCGASRARLAARREGTP
jgi:hypothetical protein